MIRHHAGDFFILAGNIFAKKFRYLDNIALHSDWHGLRSRLAFRKLRQIITGSVFLPFVGGITPNAKRFDLGSRVSLPIFDIANQSDQPENLEHHARENQMRQEI